MFTDSLDRWCRTTLDVATSDYRGGFFGSVESNTPILRASPNITGSLLRLVDAIHSFGLTSSDLHKYQLPRRLLEGLADRLASLHTEQYEAQQVAWDIALIRRLLGVLESDRLVS